MSAIGPGRAERHPWRRAVLLAAAAALLRLAYVFLLTDYPAYLVSDMRGYWHRAHVHLAGAGTGSVEWAVWPPFYHVALAGLLAGLDAIGVEGARWLAATLAVQAVLGGVAVGAVHVVARSVLPRPALADAVAALYAVTYPLVYLSAFVLSENLAVPALALAAACAVHRGAGGGRVPAAGTFLGIAVATRPALGALVPAFLVYAAASGPRGGRLLRVLAFTGGLLAVTGAASVANARLSGGELRGLGANGGVNFFVAQCRVHRLESVFREGGRTLTYRIVHPQFVDEPWRPWVATDHPPYDERYFYGRGLECWRERPLTLLENAAEARKLLWGPLFPSFTSARGFVALDPAFAALIAGAVAVALLGVPLAWVRTGRGTPELWLLWSLLALTLATASLWGAERRFLLPVVFAAYACAASVVVRGGGRAPAMSERPAPA
jgi:hypothetical protein